MSEIKRWMDRMDNEPRATEGQPLSSENVVKITSLKKSIYGLLTNHGMTNDELVVCLLCEPYNVSHNDLDLITIALNNLSEDRHLAVTFRTNQAKMTSEPVFRSKLS